MIQYCVSVITCLALTDRIGYITFWRAFNISGNNLKQNSWHWTSWKELENKKMCSLSIFPPSMKLCIRTARYVWPWYLHLWPLTPFQSLFGFALNIYLVIMRIGSKLRNSSFMRILSESGVKTSGSQNLDTISTISMDTISTIDV